MRLVTRSQWGARAPKSATALRLPSVKGFAVHWEGPAMGSFPHAECAAKVRGIQRFHMDSRGWVDLAYNFIPCAHGFVFEGRGWHARSAANGTNAGNDSYWAACYLGGQGDPFTEQAKQAYTDLFAEGRRRVQNATDVKPHSFFKATACPGDAIRRWIASGVPVPQPAPEVEPMYELSLPPGVTMKAHLKHPGGGVAVLLSDGGVLAFDCPMPGNVVGRKWFWEHGGIPARLVPNPKFATDKSKPWYLVRDQHGHNYGDDGFPEDE